MMQLFTRLALTKRWPTIATCGLLATPAFACALNEDGDGVDFEHCDGGGTGSSVDVEVGDFEEYCTIWQGGEYGTLCDNPTCPGAFYSGIVAQHTVHLHTGEVVMWANQRDQRVKPASTAQSWLPLTGADCVPFESPPDDNFFCAGHTQLADGRVMIAGGGGGSGAVAISTVGVFDPTAEAGSHWTEWPRMFDSRWYPSLTTLADGRVLVSGGTSQEPHKCVSGTCEGTGQSCTGNFCPAICMSGVCSQNLNSCSINADCNLPPGFAPLNVAQVFDPATSQWDYSDEAPTSLSDNYPNMYVLPDGNVFYAGSELANQQEEYNGYVLNTQSLSWYETGEFEAQSSASRIGGGSVMYEPGRVMRAGGTSNPRPTTEVIDLTGDYLNDDPDWVGVGDMCQRRHFHSLVLLADGTVLAAGGSRRANSAQESWEDFEGSCAAAAVECEFDSDCSTFPSESCLAGGGETPDDDVCRPENPACLATKTVELWDPADKEWKTAKDPVTLDEIELDRERMYHHTAFLTPDADVIIAGGGQRSGLEEQQNREVITPPYLRSSNPRPAISLPDEQAFFYSEECGESQITVSYSGAEPGRVTLLRPASVTHQFDSSQRFIELCKDGDLSPCEYNDVDNELIVDAPCAKNDDHKAAAIAPPGYYMLFVFSDDGVPSVAEYVQVGDAETAGFQKWECAVQAATLRVDEISCAVDPTGGCPTGSIVASAMPIPQTSQSVDGWEIMTYPGEIADPAAPTTAELDLIAARCVETCELEWSDNPAVTHNCGDPGVFATLTHLGVGEPIPYDYIDANAEHGEGAASKSNLVCALTEECCTEFGEHVCAARNSRWTAQSAGLAVRPEHRFDLDPVLSKVEITTNFETKRTGLTGTVEYSFCEDGEDALCPFYLAKLSAAHSGTPLDVGVTVNGFTRTLSLSAVSFELVQPAFGKAGGAPTNDVGFSSGGLVLRTTATIDGKVYKFQGAAKADAVEGNATSSDLNVANQVVSMSVPIDGDQVLITAKIDIQTGTKLDSPPTITIDVPSTVSCNVPFDLDSTATDADSDLATVRWAVGDDLLSPTQETLAIAGTRELRAIATDQRGAATTALKTVACVP